MVIELNEWQRLVLATAAEGPIHVARTEPRWRKAADQLTRLDLLSSGSPFDGKARRHITARGRQWLADHDTEGDQR